MGFLLGASAACILCTCIDICMRATTIKTPYILLKPVKQEGLTDSMIYLMLASEDSMLYLRIKGRVLDLVIIIGLSNKLCIILAPEG